MKIKRKRLYGLIHMIVLALGESKETREGLSIRELTKIYGKQMKFTDEEIKTVLEMKFKDLVNILEEEK